MQDQTQKRTKDITIVGRAFQIAADLSEAITRTGDEEKLALHLTPLAAAFSADGTAAFVRNFEAMGFRRVNGFVFEASGALLREFTAEAGRYPARFEAALVAVQAPAPRVAQPA